MSWADRLAVGQRVAFSAALVRDSDPDRPSRRDWVRVDTGGHSEGFLVGLRTLQNGTIESIYESDGYFGRRFSHNEWRCDGTVPAAMVVAGLRNTPIYVPIDCLEVIE